MIYGIVQNYLWFWENFKGHFSCRLETSSRPVCSEIQHITLIFTDVFTMKDCSRFLQRCKLLIYKQVQITSMIQNR